MSGQRRSISFMIRSAQRIESAMALIVAGTCASLPYGASFRAARMLAAIKSTRLRPSSTPKPIQANRPQNVVLESRLHVGFFYRKTGEELLRGMFVLKIEQRDAETPLCSEMIYF